LSQVDLVLLNWNPTLDVASFPDLEELTSSALTSLDGEVYEFWSAWLEPDGTRLALSLAYPSVSGWQEDCSVTENPICYDLDHFSSPAPRVDGLEPGFAEQAAAYQAMLSTASSKEWVSGLISRGYFSQVILHDKSISIHGKPAEDLLWRWFEALE
jgi:hypothetical protein